ncbi:MAG: hypothetical protein CVV05_00860 [Gammaproteobacteria bacterium HGW-Gammaproteobacteria-1]|jgi:mRNA-degrading endonuclease toxin of MazEF toxin-antitoxin module|nr:MAG: hypothetical protein CVV05_00860 [Gammaproteobacteria bacterium HGW-Gammaproteobacteria-1]
MAVNELARGDVVSITRGAVTQIGCVLTDSAYHAKAGVLTYCLVVPSAPTAPHTVPISYDGHTAVALPNLVQTVPVGDSDIRRLGAVDQDVVNNIVGRLLPLLGVGA